ncbi:MAG TPA: hypothetical protein VNR37_07325 [Microbacteriaceae bacterium]|jgi:hypothetical protein|nr:hypothetical protein [Microbacteriaceae bacterium]
MAPDGHAVDPNDLLRRSADRQVSFRIPAALDQRLDALLERAITAGENTTRRELLSALVLAADQTGDELSRLLREYRTARVTQALLDQVTDGNVIELRRHKPGPRAVR